MVTKLTILLLLIIGDLCYSATSAAAYIAGNRVNVYSSPSLNAPIRTYLRLGDLVAIDGIGKSVIIQGIKNQWLFVYTQQTIPGIDPDRAPPLTGWLLRSDVGIASDFSKIKIFRKATIRFSYNETCMAYITLFSDGSFSGVHTPPTQVSQIPIHGWLYGYQNVIRLVSSSGDTLYWLYFDAEKRLRVYLLGVDRKHHPYAQ